MSLNLEVAVLGTGRPSGPSPCTQKSSSWASGFGFVFFSSALVPRSPGTRHSREPRHLRASGSPSGGAVLSSRPSASPGQPVPGKPRPPARLVLFWGTRDSAGMRCWAGPLCAGGGRPGTGERAVSTPEPALRLARLLGAPDVLTRACLLAAGTSLFVIINKCPSQRTSCLSFGVTARCPLRPFSPCSDAKWVLIWRARGACGVRLAGDAHTDYLFVRLSFSSFLSVHCALTFSACPLGQNSILLNVL